MELLPVTVLATGFYLIDVLAVCPTSEPIGLTSAGIIVVVAVPVFVAVGIKSHFVKVAFRTFDAG